MPRAIRLESFETAKQAIFSFGPFSWQISVAVKAFRLHRHTETLPEIDLATKTPLDVSSAIRYVKMFQGGVKSYLEIANRQLELRPPFQ